MNDRVKKVTTAIIGDRCGICRRSDSPDFLFFVSFNAAGSAYGCSDCGRSYTTKDNLWLGPEWRRPR